jgi:hypothetical protein
MRYYRKALIILSKDETAYPKQIRFQDDREATDMGTSALIKEGGSNTVVFPISIEDQPIPMGQVQAGKYFYLLSDKDFSISINGGEPITVFANRVCEMWCAFTSLTVGPVTEVTELTYCIAGE